MDARIIKTQKAIKESFIRIRKEKSLDKITVKALCDAANVNKSTFYTHYSSLSDLSQEIEKDVVGKIIYDISKNPNITLHNVFEFIKGVYQACLNQSDIIDVLYSGNDKNRLINSLEKEIKNYIYIQNPEYKDNLKIDIILTYCIQGGYHGYINNHNVEEKVLLDVVEQIANALQPLFC